jgi:hypothetical protein
MAGRSPRRLVEHHSAASPLNLNPRGAMPSLRIRVTGTAAEALLKMPGVFRTIVKNTEVFRKLEWRASPREIALNFLCTL